MIRRLQYKITLTYALLAFVAVAAFAILASVSTQRYLYEQKTTELSQRIDVVASLLNSRVSEPLETLDSSVRVLAKAMNLRITLIESDGVVRIDSDIPLENVSRMENHLNRPEVQQALTSPVGTDTRTSASVHSEFLYVAKGVRFPAGLPVLSGVKIVRLSTHVENIVSMAAEQRKRILSAGIVVLVLVIIVSFVLSRQIAQPMREIAEAVERIRRGDLETHIRVRSNDEVGRVAQAVNEMVAKLKSDITQFKKLERVRSEFLGNVSHELRTPIFSMQGFLETLLEGAVDDPTVNREFLKKAFNHSQRLNTLLGDLLTISHIESGQMKMSFRYFSLYEFLSSLVESLRVTAQHHDVQLKLADQLNGDVEVLGDKERLRVVFDNLLENAIKYNKPGGEVVIAYVVRSGQVEISVRDTGVGIASEHVPRIFERFYRVDRNRSREVGGTGLGLAIVKHILEAHGTFVEVRSEVDKGSTFTFSLKT